MSGSKEEKRRIVACFLETWIFWLSSFHHNLSRHRLITAHSSFRRRDLVFPPFYLLARALENFGRSVGFFSVLLCHSFHLSFAFCPTCLFLVLFGVCVCVRIRMYPFLSCPVCLPDPLPSCPLIFGLTHTRTFSSSFFSCNHTHSLTLSPNAIV